MERLTKLLLLSTFLLTGCASDPDLLGFKPFTVPTREDNRGMAYDTKAQRTIGEARCLTWSKSDAHGLEDYHVTFGQNSMSSLTANWKEYVVISGSTSKVKTVKIDLEGLERHNALDLKPSFDANCITRENLYSSHTDIVAELLKVASVRVSLELTDVLGASVTIKPGAALAGGEITAISQSSGTISGWQAGKDVYVGYKPSKMKAHETHDTITLSMEQGKRSKTVNGYDVVLERLSGVGSDAPENLSANIVFHWPDDKKTVVPTNDLKLKSSVDGLRTDFRRDLFKVADINLEEIVLEYSSVYYTQPNN